MRILMVEGSGRGFLCHYAHALSLGLARDGHAVRLITGSRDELAGWDVPFSKIACLRSGWRSWWCLRRAVGAFRPEVVHLQWVDNPIAALLFVRWAGRQGIRVIYTPHNILPHRARWLTMPAYRRLYRGLDRIVARDRHIAWGLEELLDTPRNRTAFLPGSPNLLAHPLVHPHFDCASLAELPAKEPGELRLLFFGHGCERKGLGRLLQALRARRWPARMHLVIAGEEVLAGIPPAHLDALRETVRVTLIDRYIEPTGVAALFREADLMAMPYVKLCKSPLTDMAAAFRLPVLRSDRVQAACFREGLHGLTVAHDSSDELNRAIARLLGEPGLLAAMRSGLEREEAVESAIRRLARGHARLYRAALRAPGGTPADNPVRMAEDPFYG